MTPRLALAGVILTHVVAQFALAAPDEDALGKADGYPRGNELTMYADRFKVGSFSAAYETTPSREVERGASVTPLSAEKGPELVYRLKGQRYTLDDFLDRQRVTALLLLQGDRILAERYQYDRKDTDRFISFSMAKSINSLLIGIALEKGLIESLDDRAEKYVSELEGTAFGQATIRQLLRMSAGVKFSEVYDGKDDIAKMRAAQLGRTPDPPLTVLATFRERDFPAGERFAYGTAQTTVLGYVVARATGKSISELTSRWLWQPMGTEASAYWNIGVDGQEFTGGGFNATLRDYGRLGLLLARDGRLGDTQIVPKRYLLEATSVSDQPEAFRPGKATPYFGYGYQFWLYPMKQRTFALLGIFGQSIFVQPESGLVLVILSVAAEPRSQELAIERDALWRGVLMALGGKIE